MNCYIRRNPNDEFADWWAAAIADNCKRLVLAARANASTSLSTATSTLRTLSASAFSALREFKAFVRALPLVLNVGESASSL